MARYAEATSVPTERSKVEIETILRRYGATGFLSGYDEDRAFASQSRAQKLLRPGDC